MRKHHIAMITKETLIEWLRREGRPNQWLADQCGVKVATVNGWRSDRPIPSKAILIIKKLMDEADAEKGLHAIIPQHVVLKFKQDEFEKIERAALNKQKTVSHWGRDALNNTARLDQIIHAVEEGRAENSADVTKAALDKATKEFIEGLSGQDRTEAG